MTRKGETERRKTLAAVAILFGAALTLRFIYVVNLRSSPLAFFPIVDELYHVEWARALASGDWLGREVFFRAPLYPYSLGVVFALFGENLTAARVVQSLYSSLAPVVVYMLGRRVFDERAARLAGALAVVYPFFIYFTNELLIVTLVVLLDAVALHLVLRADESPSAGRWFGAGAVLGLSAIARPNVLVFIPALLGWMLWSARRRGVEGRPAAAGAHARTRYALVAFSTLLLGVVVLVAPVTVRNYVVGRDFVPIASQGGINFYIGNNAASDGASAVMPVLGEAWQYEDAVRIAEREEGGSLLPSEVSGFWYRAGRRFLLGDPGAGAGLYLRKLVLFWDRYELANNKDVYYFGNMSPVFRLFRWLDFGVVAPLALLGAVFCARRNRAAALLILFVLSYMAGLLLFFVNSRFRLPVLPVLLLFAAAGLFHLLDVARRRDWRALALSALVLAASSFFVGFDFYDTHHGDRAQTHMTLGRAAAELGDLEGAVDEYRRAIELSPGYAKAYNSMGLALERLGRDLEARDAYLAAVERDSALAFARNNLGSFYMKRGDLASARRWLESAVAVDDRLVEAHMNLALVLAESREFERAEYHLRAVVTVDPEFVAAWTTMGRVFEETGKLPQAAGAYRRALAVDPANVEARHSLGVVLAMAGRYDEALRELKQASRLSPGHPGIEANIARVRELAAARR